ncbi:MAG TPA: site-specific integrase, partial [Solirubrobacterales bacterium]
MQPSRARPVSGHVFKVERKRGAQWYAKYRLRDGRQIQRRIGPHWSDRGTGPPPGYFTKRSAQAWLDDILVKARRGNLPGMASSDTTFGDACDAWLEWKQGRNLRPSTLADYRKMVDRIKPAIAERIGERARLDALGSEDIEAFRDQLMASGASDRTTNKYLGLLTDIFKWAHRRYGLMDNPVRLVERRPNGRRPNIDVFSKEEVMALVAAATNERDGVIYLTAAFTGLRRGELLALRWPDIDFANAAIHVRRSLSDGAEGPPKSGRERTVPMMDEVAGALARLAQRDGFSDDDGLVFCNQAGGHLSGRVVSRDFHAARGRAGLRHLRFHDLRHTFASL